MTTMLIKITSMRLNKIIDDFSYHKKMIPRIYMYIDFLLNRDIYVKLEEAKPSLVKCFVNDKQKPILLAKALKNKNTVILIKKENLKKSIIFNYCLMIN